jgi:putative transposase
VADHTVHEVLRSVWRLATYWKIGPYILMPDHLHLFAWPGTLHADFDAWVRYWKSQFSNTIDNRSRRWQETCFHHRLRSWESSESKRLYMINNPVRAGLVVRSEDWPYQGEIFKRIVVVNNSGQDQGRANIGAWLLLLPRIIPVGSRVVPGAAGKPRFGRSLALPP